jgi:hypothetical protein
MVKRILIVLAAAVAVPIIAVIVYLLVLVISGSRAEFPPAGQPVAARRPGEELSAGAAWQKRGGALVERPNAAQILFDDLHVHTVYSADG